VAGTERVNVYMPLTACVVDDIESTDRCRSLPTCDAGCSLIMAALCNRAGHYIFALWFLSIFYLLSFFFLFLA